MAAATRNGRTSTSTTSSATIIGPLTTRDPRLLVGQAKTRPLDPFSEIGTTGLKQHGGYILEEWLSQLQGKRAAWVYREMADNSAVIGAILFSIRMLARKVEWRVESGDDTVIPQAGMTGPEFVQSCQHDMSHTWGDLVSEILSFLQYGWSYHECVYKKRNGDRPPEPPLAGEGEIPETQEDTAPASSKYNDGLVGWRKLPIRAQETLLRWRFRGYAGLLAMEQVDWHGGMHVIPIEKALLFRTEAARGNPEGRALALDTPVPTPDGWKTMQDLVTGSRIFDEQGRVRYVTAVADWENRPCYRLHFNDGTTIDADENHQWPTQTVPDRATGIAPRLRTTAEIAATVRNSRGIANHRIGWAAPLEYTEQHLAIDPYVLGVWLGDGSATSGRITCHADDVEEQAVLIAAAGYDTVQRHNGRPKGNGRVLDLMGAQKWVNSPQRALRVLGVLENKHIPKQYLRGSYEQRLALLQGLMDSDGTCDKFGRSEFVNTNRDLVDGVVELVRSLGAGCKATLSARAGEGKHKRDAYSVRFTPPDFCAFRLERKAERTGLRKARAFHYIVKVERLANRPTRCIEVDGPSHMFLAGRGLLASHNSILRSAYQAYFYMQNIQTDEAIGIGRELTGIPKAQAPEGVDIFSEANKPLLERVQELVTSIEKDEQQGIVLPTGWVLELMKTGGSRQVETDPVIRRYRQEIAASVLADFILVGLDDIGSYAMVDVKAELFGITVDAVLDMICEIFNRYAIPRLWRINGFKVALPRIGHSSAGRIDLEKVANFLYNIAGAGAQIPWSNELIEQLFGEAGLPANFEGEATEEVHKAETAPDGVVDLAPQLADRARVLSMQLEGEIASALKHLGGEAATAYLTVVTKAGKVDPRAVARTVMGGLDVKGWVDRRLKPLLSNHAARVAGDTQRLVAASVPGDVQIPTGDMVKMQAGAGSKLGARDIEPQIRAAIMQAVKDGLAAGDNPTKTAARIKDMVPSGKFVKAGSQYRSRLIARNETGDMQRSAVVASYQSNPNITDVRVRDGIFGPPRSDEFCTARDGDIVPIDEVETVLPHHPLCSLSLDPVVSAQAAVPVAA